MHTQSGENLFIFSHAQWSFQWFNMLYQQAHTYNKGYYDFSQYLRFNLEYDFGLSIQDGLGFSSHLKSCIILKNDAEYAVLGKSKPQMLPRSQMVHENTISEMKCTGES